MELRQARMQRRRSDSTQWIMEDRTCRHGCRISGSPVVGYAFAGNHSWPPSWVGAQCRLPAVSGSAAPIGASRQGLSLRTGAPVSAERSGAREHWPSRIVPAIREGLFCWPPDTIGPPRCASPNEPGACSQGSPSTASLTSATGAAQFGMVASPRISNRRRWPTRAVWDRPPSRQGGHWGRPSRRRPNPLEPAGHTATTARRRRAAVLVHRVLRRRRKPD